MFEEGYSSIYIYIYLYMGNVVKVGRSPVVPWTPPQDGWTVSIFGVARLVRDSTNKFKLDLAPGEILVNTSGSEFERFREWIQLGASNHA